MSIKLYIYTNSETAASSRNLFWHTEKEKGKPISFPGLNWLKQQAFVLHPNTLICSNYPSPCERGKNYTPPPFAVIGDKLLCKLRMINQETGSVGKKIWVLAQSSQQHATTSACCKSSQTQVLVLLVYCTKANTSSESNSSPLSTSINLGNTLWV